MTRRHALIFIVSLLLLLALGIWWYATRIASSVLPPLLSNHTLKIKELEIASIGWNSSTIVRLSGSSYTGVGRIDFDVHNAVIKYDLTNLRPDRVEIKQVDVEYSQADAVFASKLQPTILIDPLILPSRVTVDKFNLKNTQGARTLSGFVEFTASEQVVSLFASDETSRLRITSTPTLSNFKSELQRNDGTEVAELTIRLDDLELVDFHGAVQLAPLLDWLRAVQPLPRSYQEAVKQIETMSGSVIVTGRPEDNGQWRAQLIVGADNITTDQFYADANLEGDLIYGSDGWSFVSRLPGSIQISIPSKQLDRLSTIRFTLPESYRISQGSAASTTTIITGEGVAATTFQRIGETNLNAQLSHWQVRDLSEISIDLQDVQTALPFAASAAMAQSNMSIVHTSPLLMQGDLNISGVRHEEWPAELPDIQLKGNWNWNDGAFDSKGEASWPALPVANWSLFNHDDAGRLNIELNNPVTDLFEPMQKFFNAREQDIALTGGTVEAHLSWVWSRQLYDASLELSARNVDADVFGLKLRGGSVHLDSSDLVALSTQIVSSFSSLTFANGAEASTVELNGRWQDGLQIDRASMSVFGGKLKIDPVFINIDGKPNDIVIKVQEIDLSDLLLMLDQQGLQGDGTLSGTIPLHLSEEGVAVIEGHLHNDTKGMLSYHFGDEPPQQLNNIAIQALQDFRYDALDLNLNYQITGDYTIHARLEGRNPQLYDGYPIAFNINLNGSLPGLLKASLITGDFHTEILKQIKQQQ